MHLKTICQMIKSCLELKHLKQFSLVDFYSLLSKLADPLMKVAVPLAKNILAPLGITTAASAIDAGIQKKTCGFETTTLIISNEEMDGIMKIVQALEDSNTLLKGVTKTI